MVTVPQLCDVLERVLDQEAAAAARTSGFTQRESKLTAAVFVRALAFGWMANPNATASELVKFVATQGVQITSQGLEQRFTFAAAALLRHVLERAVEHVLAADPAEAGLLRRFAGVIWQDSSVITLPDACSVLFIACGGSPGAPRSALKVHVHLDALTGAMRGPLLTDATHSDQVLLAPHSQAEPGHLQLKDRGYWDVGRFAEWDRAGVAWMSYLHTGTKLFDADGRQLDLVDVLDTQQRSLERRVRLSAKHKLECRLVAARVSPEVEAARCERLAAYERKHGPATRLQRMLTRWSVVVTNVRAETVTLKQVLVLMRSRWQIEILFKVWKSQLGVGTSRSQQPARVLCEVLGKLLVGVIEHWIELTSLWQRADRSLTKAAIGLRAFAGALALAFGNRPTLESVLTAIVACLPCGSSVTKRGANPSAAQLWTRFASAP